MSSLSSGVDVLPQRLRSIRHKTPHRVTVVSGLLHMVDPMVDLPPVLKPVSKIRRGRFRGKEGVTGTEGPGPGRGSGRVESLHGLPTSRSKRLEALVALPRVVLRTPVAAPSLTTPGPRSLR